MSILFLFVDLSPMDLAAFVSSALVAPEDQTPEMLELCDKCDGVLPGESGDTPEETAEVTAAVDRLLELVEPWVTPTGATVPPPDRHVTRVVTVSFYSG